MKIEQEPKYNAEMEGEPPFETRLVNRASGEVIPDDEPVIIFRARDRHACDVLAHYRRLCSDEHHKRVINDRWHDFHNFAEAHPERMKEPDT